MKSLKITFKKGKPQKIEIYHYVKLMAKNKAFIYQKEELK